MTMFTQEAKSKPNKLHHGLMTINMLVLAVEIPLPEICQNL